MIAPVAVTEPGAEAAQPRGSTADVRSAVRKRVSTIPVQHSKGQKRGQCEGAEQIPRPLRSRKSFENMEALRLSVQSRPPLRNLHCVVVSLERRPDRMAGCARRLAAHCPGLCFERLLATDGRATVIPVEEVSTSWRTDRNVTYQKKRSIRKGWDDLDTYKERVLELSPGERGCSLSHVRAWRQCLELAGDTNKPLLVLEDDAAPTPEFEERLARALAALPSDADLLYLGYSQAAEWRREVSPELVESEYVWTTVAYIIWPSCARKFLTQLPVSEPVDNWMASLCAAGDIKAYCVRPKIVLQADAWNVNSDVAHSDEHYWGPCSDIRHSDEVEGEQSKADAGDMIPGTCFFGMDSSDSEDSGNDL